MTEWLLRHQRNVRDGCMIVAILVLSVFTGLLFHDTTSESKKIAAYATQIQASRMQNCHESNARHSTTVAVLKQIIATAEQQETSAERAGTQSAYSAALLVINALAPQQNCAAATTTSH